MKELKTDEDLVKVLDDLKHYIKPLVVKGHPFARLFNFWLNGFVLRYGLDKDKDAFVVIPEDGLKIPTSHDSDAFLMMLRLLERELLTAESFPFEKAERAMWVK